MNIRIKELAEQAWDSLIDEMGDVVSEDGQLNSDFLHAYVQQFAESIVRECAERLLHDVKLTDIQTTRCVASIKEHFGVGE